MLTGSRGRLARALAPSLASACGDVVRVSRTAADDCLSYEDAFDGDVFTRASVIVHCAWSSVPSLSENHPGMEWRNDLPLLSKVLAGLRGHKEPPLFVFLSSAGTVYGNSTDRPSDEDSPLNPIGWYGRAKVAAEELCRHFHATSEIPMLILRVSNPYGMTTSAHRPQGIVAAAIHALASGEPLTVWGDGSAEKDYLHIDDLRAAIVAVVQRRLTGCYNVCRGKSHTVADVLNRISTLAGRPLPVRHVDGPAWDVVTSRVSGLKLRHAIGWEATIPLNEGIQRCMSCFSE